MIPFLFSKMFNIVNDKQTTDGLKTSIFSSRWNRFVSVLIVGTDAKHAVDREVME